jgi:hypothetical protein
MALAITSDINTVSIMVPFLFQTSTAEQHNLSSTLRDHSQCLQRMEFVIAKVFSV